MKDESNDYGGRPMSASVTPKAQVQAEQALGLVQRLPALEALREKARRAGHGYLLLPQTVAYDPGSIPQPQVIALTWEEMDEMIAAMKERTLAKLALLGIHSPPP